MLKPCPLQQNLDSMLSTYYSTVLKIFAIKAWRQEPMMGSISKSLKIVLSEATQLGMIS